MIRKTLYGAVILLSATACDWNPFSPSKAGSESDRFTWTVDGQSLRASSNGMGALRRADTVSIDGVDCSGGAGLNIQVRRADVTVGTYAVGEAVIATFTPDGRSSASAAANWEAGSFRGGSGSVTVSSISGPRVAGSFTFEMVPGPGNPGAGTKSVQGTFDVSFNAGRIC